MEGLNVAQIIDRARARGVNLSNEEADRILSQAWDQRMFGADPSRVDALIGGSSSQSSNPVLDFLKSVADETAKKYDEYYKRLKDFDEANPYNADEWLAEERAGATQRLDPYYEQSLSDYLTGVETKRTRSREDERTLLDSLQGDVDYYQGRSRTALEGALEKSREGYAESGLYGSGASYRNQGQITEQSQAEEGDFLRKAGERSQAIQTTTKRNLDDLLYNEGIYRRDLEREKQYNIENSAYQGLNRRTGQYAFERAQAAGTPPGVNPVQYDASIYNYLT